MFGKTQELLPKDILVDLESDPNRVDEMLERISKEERVASEFDGTTFSNVSRVEAAFRQMQALQQVQMQNQQGGLQNGFNSQSIGTALGSFGGIFGPRS